MMRFFLILFLSLPGLNVSRAQDPMAALDLGGPADFSSLQPKTDTWLGCKRYLFTVDGCACWVTEPKDPAPGNHWAWWMMFPEAYPDRTGQQSLLQHGYYVAFMDVGNTFGAPSAMAHLSAFYRTMIDRKMRAKVVLVGLSRGGLYAYNWAFKNADKISAIYGDAPVCSFASWPYAQGVGKTSDDWKALLAVYGFKTDDEALACPTQPIKEMGPIALAQIPLLNVVGDADTTVPVADNTAVIQAQYEKLGGQMTVLHKPGGEHHPHGLDNPAPIVDFIVEHDR